MCGCVWVHGCVCVLPADGPPGPPRAVAARRDIAGAGGQPLRGVAAIVAIAVAEATEATATVAAGAVQRQWQRPGRRSGSGSARDSGNCSTRHNSGSAIRLTASVCMPSPPVAMLPLSDGASGGHAGNAASGGPPKLALTVCGRWWWGAPAVAVAAPAVAVVAPAVATQSRVLHASPVPAESARKWWR